jgi:hypothetical protein
VSVVLEPDDPDPDDDVVWLEGEHAAKPARSIIRPRIRPKPCVILFIASFSLFNS